VLSFVADSTLKKGGEGMIYQFGDCTLDTVRDEVRRSGEVINTTPQALVVLRYLLEHRDRVVSRDELFEQCWPENYVSDATLTSCLRCVRQAIGQTRTGPKLIETLHRRGYRFVTAVTELAEDAPLHMLEPLVPCPALTPDPVAMTER
jgi:DNA-binding winged helix-turn-helix (wHTH) protein